MGCILDKPPRRSPLNQGIERLKQERGYVGTPNGQRQQGSDPAAGTFSGHEGDNKRSVVVMNGANGGGEKPGVVKEGLKKGGVGNVSKRSVLKKISGDELVEGWPKWLVDNIPKEVLAGLVPKSADSYVKLAKVGQGTYSNVYKARDKDTGKIVALKKVRFDTSESESIKFMAREIMILQKLDHPNVIKLEGLATSRMKYSLYLVFDFMRSDLIRVISRLGQRLIEPHVGISSSMLHRTV